MQFWSHFGPEKLLDIYRMMLMSRYMDEQMLIMLRQGKSFFHIGAAGHEAAQVGAALAFRPGFDWAYPYYRDQAFVLQWGVPVKAIFMNFLARANDPSSAGRQLPQHYGYAKLNIVTQSSSTGTQYLQAVGTAMGCKKSGAKKVVYVSSGEGATSQGDFYEAINWASRDRLPVIFFIEDNKYAISVHRDNQAAGLSVYEMVAGYKNLHRFEIDGLDVAKAYDTVRQCVQVARQGKGPSLIVAHTIRLFSHSSSDDQRKYRNDQELLHEKEQDPLLKFSRFLQEKKLLSDTSERQIKEQVKGMIRQAAQEAESEPMPLADDVDRHLFGDDQSFLPRETVEPGNPKPAIVMVDAINHALKEEMRRNEKMLIYGQDVADAKGGVFTATKGLSSEFGLERVFNSPLAESSIIGTAIGLAVCGYKPVVEIQFGDYIWTAMMQIRNELATVRWRSNGTFQSPVVIRVPVGGYIHGGLCHSQNIEGFFSHVPGLYICYPSNAADAKGLLKQAIRLNDPVLFLEHKALYRQSYAMSPEPDQEYLLPFGRGRVARAGKDATIITYGAMVWKSLTVANELSDQGFDIEVIDLRTLQPLDQELILNSIKKTNRAVVVHEDTLTGGFGGEIVALLADAAFEWLDAPIKRVAAKDLPIPFNWELEKAVLPQENDIRNAVLQLLRF